MWARLFLVAFLPAVAGGLLTSCAESSPSPATRSRVVLLGLSGADPDILGALVAAGELPALGRVMREGAGGRLQSISPLLSPIAATTIATGKNPVDHGVAGFLVEDQPTERLLPVPSYLRRVEAVWDILGTRGYRVGVVGWPATTPPEPVNGHMIPDRPEDSLLDGPAPTDLWPAYRHHVARADRFLREALRIWRDESPSFLAVHIELLDAVCHQFMTFAPPRMDHVPKVAFSRYRSGVAEAYRHVDRLVGEIVAVLDDETTLLVVSDHGMKSGVQRLLRTPEPGHRSVARWHRPYGVFLAFGRGVRRGRTLRGATIHDVTPTVLALLGLPSAEDMVGEFLEEAFRVPPPGEPVATYETDRAKRIFRMAYGEESTLPWGLPRTEPLGFPGRTLTVSEPLTLGAMHIGRVEMEKARRAFELALRQNPASARAHFQLGHCFQKMRQPEKARFHYEAAGRLDPQMTAAHIRLAQLLEESGQLGPAIRRARFAVGVEPENPVAHYHLGHFLKRAGRTGEAEKEFLRSITLEPSFPDARNQLGILLVARKAYARAEAHFQAAIDIDPGYRKAWNNLGVTALRRAAEVADPRLRGKALDRAQRTIEDGLARFPDYSKAYYNRARLQVLRNRPDLALADAQEALTLDPDYEEARKLVENLRR